MKYETIFRRLDEGLQPFVKGKMAPTSVLNRARKLAWGLEAEIARVPVKEWGRHRRTSQFRITVSPDLKEGARFIEVNLEHKQGKSWQTRATGFLDTEGVRPVSYVSRSHTLGGDLSIQGQYGSEKSPIYAKLERLAQNWGQSPLLALA